MLKQYFQRITLFTILAFASLVAFIIIAIGRYPEEIKSDLLVNLISAVLIFITIDILLKQVLKIKTGWLWCLQILLLLFAIYLWIIQE